MKKISLCLAGILALAACGADVEYDYPVKVGRNEYARESQVGNNKMLGGEGLNIFGGNEEDEAAKSGGSSVGVNSFLWRGTLDTLSFMPLASADPFGGVVITDWFSMPEKEDEQFKINAFILSRTLRADGIKVSAFRKERKDGEWVGAEVDKDTIIKIENAILSRAREIRMKEMPAK